MQFVSTSTIALLTALMILRFGPVRGLWLFFATLPVVSAAALNLPALGGASITVADAAAAALCLAMLAKKGSLGALLATIRPPSPGFLLLVLFVFVTFSALYFPRFFEGQTEVFSLARVEGRIGIVSRPLKPSSGNTTQYLRIVIGVAVFLVLATTFRRQPDPSAVVKAMTAAVIVHVTFGFVDVITFNLGIAHVLDFFRTSNYAMATNQIMFGVKRMVGGFPEASAFGYMTLGLFGFWLQYWSHGGRAWYSGWVVFAVFAVLLLSTSSSAYVATFAFLILFTLFNSRQIISRQMDVRLAYILIGAVVAAPLTITGIVLAYETLPGFTAFLDRVIFDKLQSDSGLERMSWNIQAFRNFLDTWMIGAGLGSVRASNWLLATLASLGLLGTLFFAVFLAAVFRTRCPDPQSETGKVVDALKMGCLALLLRAMVVKATPNLELLFFAMAGLIVGLSAGAYLSQRGAHPEPVRDQAIPTGAVAGSQE